MSAAVHHPIFARFYTLLSRAAERTGVAEHRRETLTGLAGEVVEVGAGNGLNFAHYPAEVTRVLAVEPEPYLRAKARDAASAAAIPVTVIEGTAEALPLEDASVDAGVASLVLCSVGDQAGALAELRRVIRPGGELRFYEHVRSGRPKEARFQRRADRVWPRFSGGCHTSRDTPGALEAAGFEILEMRRFRFGPRVCNPAAPHVIGRARRPALEGAPGPG